MPQSSSLGRHQALLRGGRLRNAGRLRPRICRRLPELGTADCGISPRSTAASPTVSAAIRPPMCPLMRPATSQDIARDDVVAVMDALGIDKAHVVGHSMGAYTALHVGIRYPHRCLSVAAAGCGWGSTPDAETRDAMKAMAARDRKDVRRRRHRFGGREIRRCADASGAQAQGPARLAEFARMLAEHSAEGHALTMLNLQLKRPTLWEMEDGLEAIFGAAPGNRRRRRRSVPRRQRVSQAHRADRRLSWWCRAPAIPSTARSLPR